MTTALRRATKLLLVLVGSGLIYVIAAWIAVVLPAGEQAVPDSARTETIHITSNGVHTGIVVAVANDRIDWRRFLGETSFPIGLAQIRYVGFGWGAREFYLNAPTWDHLTMSIAANAMLWDRTYNHVSLFTDLPSPIIKQSLSLTPNQMERLETFIRAQFPTGESGMPVLAAQGYRGNDAFFAAHGRYSPFNTCNQWTSRALRAAGQQVAIWAPFAGSILWSLNEGD